MLVEYILHSYGKHYIKNFNSSHGTCPLLQKFLYKKNFWQAFADRLTNMAATAKA